VAKGLGDDGIGAAHPLPGRRAAVVIVWLSPPSFIIKEIRETWPQVDDPRQTRSLLDSLGGGIRPTAGSPLDCCVSRGRVRRPLTWRIGFGQGQFLNIDSSAGGRTKLSESGQGRFVGNIDGSYIEYRNQQAA